jgi:Protein of unknown function (DUF4232)
LGFVGNRTITAGLAVAATALGVGGCSSSGHAAVADAGTASSTSGVQACTDTFLGMSLGRRSGTTTVTQAVNVTNNGTTACVLDGYPGVNLIGAAHGVSQYTWTLQWATLSHTPVTLEPGGMAHFNVVYLAAAGSSGTAMASGSPSASPATTGKSGADGKSGATGVTATKSASAKTTVKATATATPGKSASPKSAPVDIEVLNITITLPNTYTQDRMAWYAEMVLQDKVEHAQTYVTPFVAGGA